jgi:quinol monooxygenase YgiN
MQKQSFTPEDDVTQIVAMFGARLKNPDQPFTLIVRMRMKDGVENRVDVAFARARSITLKEPGAISFDLNRDATNPNEIVVYERWRCLREAEAHLRAPHVTTLRKAFNNMLDGLPEFSVLTPAGE